MYSMWKGRITGRLERWVRAIGLERLIPTHDFLLDVPTIGKRKFIKALPGENASSRLRRLYGQEMVLIKAEDLEAGWSMDPGYIREGLSKRNLRKIERFEKFLAENKVIEAANIHINVAGRIAFRDGQHRTRVLLSLGMEVIPVTMPTASREFCERHYPCDQG